MRTMTTGNGKYPGCVLLTVLMLLALLSCTSSFTIPSTLDPASPVP